MSQNRSSGPQARKKAYRDILIIIVFTLAFFFLAESLEKSHQAPRGAGKGGNAWAFNGHFIAGGIITCFFILLYHRRWKEYNDEIREHKKNEDEIRKTHSQSAMMLSAISSIIIGIDGENKISQWNTAAAAAFGIKREEIIGKPFLESGIQWEWREVLENIFYSSSENKSFRIDEIPYTNPEGQIRFLGLTVCPFVDAADNHVEILLLGRDITATKLMSSQLVQAQKLESIGQLAAGIAHEINTPMQYVSDNTHFLQESFRRLNNVVKRYQKLAASVKATSDFKEIILEIDNAVEEADLDFLMEEIPPALEQTLTGIERVAKIVRAMKEFSHPGSEEKKAVDINQAIENTITVARNEWKYVAEMKTDFAADLPLVPCLVGEFNQVILNIIVNAAQAIAGVVGDNSGRKGLITVTTRNADGWAEVRISDTGPGIPPEAQARIFDPFFTTKEVGKGTGQGLALARSVIVDKHGGALTFATEEGQGTTFIIRIPLSKEPLNTEGN